MLENRVELIGEISGAYLRCKKELKEWDSIGSKGKEAENLIQLATKNGNHELAQQYSSQLNNIKSDLQNRSKQLIHDLNCFEDHRVLLESHLKDRPLHLLWNKLESKETINKLEVQLKEVQTQIEELEDQLIETGFASKEEIESKILCLSSKIYTLTAKLEEEGKNNIVNQNVELKNQLALLESQKDQLEVKRQEKMLIKPRNLSEEIFVLNRKIKDAKKDNQKQINALTFQKENLEKIRDLRYQLLVHTEQEKFLKDKLLFEKHSPNPVKFAWENLSIAFQLHEKNNHIPADPFEKQSMTEEEIEKFQNTHCMPATEIFDEATIDTLLKKIGEEISDLKKRSIYELRLN